MTEVYSTGKKDENREDLTGEHPLGHIGQLLCLSVFALVWGADSFVINCSTALNEVVSAEIRYTVGLVLGVISVALVMAGHKTIFHDMRQTPHVVREGVFGAVRHPMYLGSLVFYLGLVMTSVSLVCVIVWIGIAVFHHRIARYEEQLLIARFGDKYRQYMAEVPMWLPVNPSESGHQ